MNKMIKFAPLAIAAAVALAACGKKEEPAKKEAPKAAAPAPAVVKIGHVAPLTGSIAHLGKDNENGARMAVDEINAAGGVDAGGTKLKLELVAEDEVAELSTALRPSEPLVHEVIRSYLVELLEREDRAGRLRPGTDLHEAADYLARMLLSALSAPVGRDLTDEVSVRELVRTQFVGGIVVAG